MKISKRARAEFEFYRDTPLDMIGFDVRERKCSDASGQSALECWYAKDTHGKSLQCREPELLDKVFRGKKSVNLQVELWAEDLGLLLAQPELVEYCHGWPAWVFSSVMEQAGKRILETVGFVPRFARFETVFGNWWPHEMDSFDPKI